MPGPGDAPFSYRVAKEGSVRIAHGSRVVTVVAGARASRLRRLLADAGGDPDATQQLLARATGNFKRGNERPG